MLIYQNKNIIFILFKILTILKWWKLSKRRNERCSNYFSPHILPFSFTLPFSLFIEPDTIYGISFHAMTTEKYLHLFLFYLNRVTKHCTHRLWQNNYEETYLQVNFFFLWWGLLKSFWPNQTWILKYNLMFGLLLRFQEVRRRKFLYHLYFSLDLTYLPYKSPNLHFIQRSNW